MNGYNKKIAGLKGAFECSSCGKMVAKDMSFCPYCGAKAEKEDEAEEVFEGEVCDEAGEEKESKEGDGVISDEMKEKAADAAKNVAEKAEKAAEKAADKLKE